MENRAIERASAPHGQKRHAEDNLDDEQRFTKRFNLLNLGTILTIVLFRLDQLNANPWSQNILTGSISQFSTPRREVNLATMALRILCN